MQDFFREQSECIRIYIGIETIEDPYEKNRSVTLLNPVPIRAIVSDLLFSQINWKLPGIVTEKAKEITVEKKHRNLIEKSQKIEVKENNVCIAFEGWRVNGRMQIREEGDFIRLYIYSKHV